MAKLSKREQAAKASGGTLNYKTGKVTVAPKIAPKMASKTPSYSMNPEDAPQTTSQYENRIASGLGNTQSVAAAKNEAKLTSSPSKQREAAAKAQKSSSQKLNLSGISSGADQNFTPAINYTPAPAAPATTGFKGFLNRAFGEGSFLGNLSDAGLVQGNAGRLAGLVRGSTPSAYASEGDQQFPGQEMNYTPMLPGEGSSRITDTAASSEMTSNQPFSSVSDTADTAASRYSSLFGDNTGGGRDTGGARKNSSQELPNYLKEAFPNQTDIQSPNDFTSPALPDKGGQTRPLSFGAGKASNGALLGGNPAEDNYIKELRRAYSGDGGIKELRRQFEELIKQLDPTYDQYQKEGTDALNAQLQNNSTQLASVMNAGNVGDSEQRAQQLAQLQSGNQTALGNLLAKLATAKAGDISNYKSQMLEKVGQAKNAQQTNKQKLLQLIREAQQSGQKVSTRTAGGLNTGKLSHNDIFNWTNDALSKGYTWQEIADNAQQQGIDTSTGSYLDQLLNNANKQNRFAQ